MKLWVKLLLAFTLAACAHTAQQPLPFAAPLIQPAQLREDLAILREAMENGPPGIYLYISEEELDAGFARAEAQITAPMSEIEFFRVAAPLVASAHHGHMVSRLSPATFQRIWTQMPLLPLGVRFIEGRAYIFRDFTDQSLEGAELLSLNGVRAPVLLSTIGRTYSVDANQPLAREHVTGGLGFVLGLATHYGMTGPFQAEIAQNGGRRTVTLQGVAGVADLWAQRFPNDREVRQHGPAGVAYDGDVAILTIPHWDYEQNGEQTAAYHAFMEEIARHRSRALIIDIRDNSGGEDSLASHLLSYLVSEPFPYFRCAVFKNDRFAWLSHADGEEIEAALPNYIGPVSERCRELGAYALTNRPNLGIVQPRTPHFGGPVFVLTNAGSFSTSVEFAAHIKSTRRGAIIGASGQGSYWSNDSGIIPTLTLPNSGVQVDIPLIHYRHELRNAAPIGRVVAPDWPVQPSIAQMLAGEDPEMALALSLARRAL